MIKVSSNPNFAVSSAVSLLRTGKVIAVPTDTVYGLAASAEDPKALEKLYAIKVRDLKKALAVCVAKVSDVGLWSKSSHLPEGLLEALLPGPVTVVLKRNNRLSPFLNPGNPLVAIRVPNDDFIQKVARSFNAPIALTSANVSCEPSSLAVSEFQQLWPHLGGIFDGGLLAGSRKASTIVDLSIPRQFSVLRNGSALDNTVKTLELFGLKEKNV